jgi:hypothetical protein
LISINKFDRSDGGAWFDSAVWFGMASPAAEIVLNATFGAPVQPGSS